MLITINTNNDGKEIVLFGLFKLGFGKIQESGLWLLLYVGIHTMSIGMTFNWTRPKKVEINTSEVN